MSSGKPLKRGSRKTACGSPRGVVLGVALLFGWRYYQSHQNEVALQAASQFAAMAAADRTSAIAISRGRSPNGLIGNFPKTPFADQARLTIARAVRR